MVCLVCFLSSYQLAAPPTSRFDSLVRISFLAKNVATSCAVAHWCPAPTKLSCSNLNTPSQLDPRAERKFGPSDGKTGRSGAPLCANRATMVADAANFRRGCGCSHVGHFQLPEVFVECGQQYIIRAEDVAACPGDSG